MRYLFLVAAFIFSMNQFNSVCADPKYNIKEMTPEVKSALEGRRDRFENLGSFKAQGMIGENNKGYVEALSANAEVTALVEAENKDRAVIYKTIEEQNNLQNALATIETVFAQEQRERANAGDKIQNPDGTWVTK